MKILTKSTAARLKSSILASCAAFAAILVFAYFYAYDKLQEDRSIPALIVCMVVSLAVDALSERRSPRRVETSADGLKLTDFRGEDKLINIADIHEIRARKDTIGLRLADKKSILIEATDKADIEAFIAEMKTMGSFELVRSGWMVRTYRRPGAAEAEGELAPEVREAIRTLTCRLCGKTYPSRFWFEDNLMRCHAECIGCREKQTASKRPRVRSPLTPLRPS